MNTWQLLAAPMQTESAFLKYSWVRNHYSSCTGEETSKKTS